MRIDAHQHYWKISRGDYGWITPDLKPLYRDYLPADLRSALLAHKVERTIVVQAAPTLDETDFLLRLTEQEDAVAGVVGWIDVSDSACQSHFERLSKHPKFVGFRVMIQDMADPSVILQPGAIQAFRMFAEMDCPIDLLVKAHQLEVLLQLLEKVPTLRAAINHLAKPDIAHAVYNPWKTQMETIAQYPSVYCKLSGMVTEADHRHWRTDDFADYVHHVVNAFGPDRLMYGSDWPVCLLAASYDQVFTLAQSSLPQRLTDADRDKIFGANAATFYKIDQRTAQESER